MVEKKIKEIVENTRTYITKNKNVPATITVGQVKYNYATLNYIFVKSILDNKAKLQDKTMVNAPSPTGKIFNGTITKAKYINICKTMKTFYDTNKRSSNYIEVTGTKVHPLVFIDVLSRILKFQIDNHRLPASVKIDTSIMKKNSESPIQSNDSVFNYFVKVFGKVSTIDEALGKVKGRGYGYYYNDYLSNKQTIDNLKGSGKKPNCTDSCQLFYHIGKALGYEVRVIHVLCKSSGSGHVRLQLKHSKHTGGSWINRDPACVISDNGKPVTCIWCGNGSLIATNPKWFFESVNR